MNAGNFIAYFRVSTDRQGQSGLGLDAQRKAVMDFLNGGDWELIEEFTEVESGKRTDRPKLDAALAACRKRKATLVIAKLDRLARNVHFITGLMESKVDFVAADNPTANKLTVHIMAAMAEHEGEQISIRTKDGLAIAKAKGTKLGNPRKRTQIVKGEKRTGWDDALSMGREVITAKADQFAENVFPIIEAVRSSGVETLQGIADALNNRGIKTRRGGDWYPTTVKNILKRA
jgi:DNA invertase Pin-like site-specific DNA recombinase